MIDGHWFAQDGRKRVWNPPNWIRLLEAQGYDPATDDDPVFVVSDMQRGELNRFDDLRDALRFALAALKGDRHPESISIDCRTYTRLVAPVVWGRPVAGMAHGALEAEPIVEISAPAD